MEPIYILQVESTGEKILLETVPASSLYAWQNRTEKKMMRRRNRAQRFRDAIRDNDTIAGWYNFDDFVASPLPRQDLQALSDRIFKGYDKWYNTRRGSTWEARD